jgi:hypothetical protein
VKNIVCSGWSRIIVSSAIFLTLVVVSVLSSSMLSTAQADELYGRVRGIVSDSSGASLPGVELKLANLGMGTVENDRSDSDGSFTFVNLKPGQYKLTATKSSFKTFEASGIKVEPNQVYVQNVSMELGGISETIEVAANQAGPQLD